MDHLTGVRTIPIVALDFDSAELALDMVERLAESCVFYKVGSELFTAAGPRMVHELCGRGCDVFLDLKLHDIPNTVARAVAAAARLGASMLTVHAVGGERMVQAAVENAGATCGVFVVTVLTSLDADQLARGWGRNPDLDMEAEVVRLADVAVATGARGVVCSGSEAEGLRRRFGSRLELVVPGVRLAGAEADDQARVVTPGAAARAGVSYVVLGRSVTAAQDPAAAMAQAVASLG